MIRKSNFIVSASILGLYVLGAISTFAADDNKKKWKIDLKDARNFSSRNSNIEIIHAEQGKYLGAQKSKEGILIFQGGIIVKLKSYTLFADTVKINADTGEIYGEGEVTLIDALQVMKGSKFIYNNRIGAGVLYALDGYFKPLYIIGDYSKITDKKNLIISAAFFSTCDAENPHYFLKAQKIWLQENQKFVALGVIFYVGQVPLFYLPFLIQTDIGTGIHTLFGSSSSRGIFMQNTYFYGFPGKNILPQNGVLMLDFYQYDGIYLGTYFDKKSANLNYNMDLGIAFWTQKTPTSSTTQPFTNQIPQSDGSVKNITSTLYEINILLNTKWNSSLQKDSLSALNVVFEQYNNRSFDYLFKGRKVPLNTLDSISTSDLFGLDVPRSLLNWKAIYSENWLDNNFQVSLERYQVWDGNPTSIDGIDHFNTQLDIFPSVYFHKNWYIVKPTSRFFQGITNEILINAGLRNEYSGGFFDHMASFADLKSGFNAYFPLHSLISIQPSVGYGVKGQFYNIETPAQHFENGRKSYQYIYNIDRLILGPTFLKLTATYSLQLALQPRFPDPNFFNETGNYSEIENKVYLNLNSDFAPYGSVALNTSRDLRLFPGSPLEPIYWDPISASAFFDYDFINNDNLYLPERTLRDNFYMGFGLNESLIYNIRFNTFGANSLALYFQTGGYQFLFFEKIQLLKIGAYWYHNFLNSYQNSLSFYFATKVSLLKYWAIDLMVSANAPHLGTTSAPYQLLSDYINSPLNNSPPFYLDKLSVSLEHDLHDWTMTLTYALNQVWVPFSNNINYAGYYEHKVFISFNLKGLTGVGADKFQLYNFNPKEYRDKFGIY